VGAYVDFICENGKKISVFTTRPDTIYGVTYIAIAPENKVISEIVNSSNETQVNEYINQTKAKTEVERKEAAKKTGVALGTFALNPITGKKIPIYTADYVLNNYATGMVMGVPAHDQRD
jgi:leucyl-tRNA synthetase